MMGHRMLFWVVMQAGRPRNRARGHLFRGEPLFDIQNLTKAMVKRLGVPGSSVGPYLAIGWSVCTSVGAYLAPQWVLTCKECGMLLPDIASAPWQGTVVC